MGTSILFLADTHLPKRATRLPVQVWDAVDTADVVIHAGDWVSVALLDELEVRAKALVGVYGNNDGVDLRARLPEITRTTIDGVRFAVVRCDTLFPDEDVLVFGHSHIPWDTRTPGGLGDVTIVPVVRP